MYKRVNSSKHEVERKRLESLLDLTASERKKGQKPEVEWRSGRFTWLYCRPLQASPDLREPATTPASIYRHYTWRERESPRHQQGNFLLVLVIVFTFSSTFTPLDWVRPPQEKCHEIKIKVKETYDCVKAPPHHTTLYCIIITTLYTVYIGRWAPSIFILLLSCWLVMFPLPC